MSVGFERDNRIDGPIKRFYDFGAFRIDANKRLLLKDGEPVPLASKAFDTLLVLVENRGQLVSKDELMSRLWPDTVVEEGSLTRNIYLLRKALGEARGQNLYIVTVPGQGYRFVADVCEISEENLDLRVTERTRTMIVVSEEEGEDRDEEFLELPPAPATGVRALEVSRTAGPSTAGILRQKPVIVICALAVLAAVAMPSGCTPLTDRGRRKPGSRGLPGDGDNEPDQDRQRRLRGSLARRQLCRLRQGRQPATKQPLDHAPCDLHRPGHYPARRSSIPHADLLARRRLYLLRDEGEQCRAACALQGVDSGGAFKEIERQRRDGSLFSPDGSQIVFRRSIGERRSAALFVANADGTGEREIAWIKHPEGIGDPAWSPDGKTIVCASGRSTGGTNMYVAHVPAEAGRSNPSLPKNGGG